LRRSQGDFAKNQNVGGPALFRGAATRPQSRHRGLLASFKPFAPPTTVKNSKG
jgi:hypothetical protein